jgi:hypothetical protein
MMAGAVLILGWLLHVKTSNSVAAGLGKGLVDELEELAAVDDLDEWRGAVGAVSDDPNGGSVIDADALAERPIGVHLRRKLTHGIDSEGQGNAVAGRKLVGKLAELIGSLDGDLVGKDVVAVVVSELFVLGVEKAGIDGGLETPGMVRQWEIVTQPWNVVFGRGLHENRIGAGALGALHVGKLENGDTRTGRGLESGGVVDLRGSRRGELGAGCSRGKEKHGRDEDQGEVKAGMAGMVPAGRKMSGEDQSHVVFDGSLNLL